MTDFIIIGSINALFYKDIFPYVEQGKITLGCTHRHIGDEGEFYLVYNNEKVNVDTRCRWMTNIPIDFTYEHPLTEKYTPEKYPTYDNYPDAINIDKARDIPCDYYGVMGVPISFMDKYNPKQFKIVGKAKNPVPTINGKNKYVRLLIRRKKNGG